MSRTIWKYPVVSGFGHWSVEMPQHADVLTIQMQDNQPCMWAIVNPAAPKIMRHFATVGTGHDLPENADWMWGYIGTFQVSWLVLHVFAVPEPDGQPTQKEK